MKQSLKPPQVAFVHAMLTEPLPIAADSIDCILSNCVVNLLPLPGKSALFKETYRVLRPGGRMVLDDVNLLFILYHRVPNNQYVFL
jgi:arsenite methyltransferase